jgi:predicted RNA-binding Zn-ribbon protein involved in translation (DUF1610 family)
MNQNPDSHSTRRIVLPSGRAIEVVHFVFKSPTTRGLHICPECGSRLVQPIEWREPRRRFWELVLSCPNCGWLDEGVFTQDQVDQFEEHLDEGLAEMLNDLRRLTQANMAEEIDRLSTALQTDLILPEDF